MTVPARTLAALVACAALLASPLVSASEPEEPSVAAEALFQEGRALMVAKKYAEACAKFAESHELDPAIGTLLNLADCYEKNGQLATAWRHFREAITFAQELGRPERERTARDRAESLEPRLANLWIVSATPSAEIRLDGRVLDASSLGAPIPVDPGTHTIVATAKGKKARTFTVDFDEKTKTRSIEIPPLEDEESQQIATEEAIVTPVAPTRASSSFQKTLGVVVAAAGCAGLGVGTAFGWNTSSTWAKAKRHCTGLECDATGVALAREAKTSGNISTVAFAAGGALLLGGVVLFFTAPSAPRAAPPVRVGVGPGSVVVGGTFR